MKRINIGLALSGGGARCIAHIGVIRALYENGLEPAVISGASGGAIIGSMLAAGKTVGEMTEFVKRGSLWKAYKFGLPFDGLGSLDNFKTQLGEFIEIENLESLPTPLFISVANLLTGEPEIFYSGPLLDIVIASSSIPLIFKPVEIDGGLYVDGGVMMNMPARSIVPYCNLVIGSNVRPRVPISKKSVQNVFGIAERVFDLSLQGNIKLDESLCDVVISSPDLHQFGLFQFNKWEQLISIGYESAVAALPEIKLLVAERKNELL